MYRIPILPTSLMRFNHCDTMIMVLAHLYDVDEQYTKEVDLIRDKGAYVILDNGVIEGDQRPAMELIAKALKLRANEVVLPDAFCNHTMNASYFDTYYPMFRKFLPGVKLMAVIHGASYHEYLSQFHYFMTAGIDVIGIPKIMSKYQVDRNVFVRSILSLGYPKQVELHFLGCNEGMGEIEVAEGEKRVRSIDSAFPYVQAAAGLSLHGERSTTFNIAFDDLNDDPEFLDRLVINLAKWRMSCNVRSVPMGNSI